MSSFVERETIGPAKRRRDCFEFADEKFTCQLQLPVPKCVRRPRSCGSRISDARENANYRRARNYELKTEMPQKARGAEGMKVIYAERGGIEIFVTFKGLWRRAVVPFGLVLTARH